MRMIGVCVTATIVAIGCQSSATTEVSEPHASAMRDSVLAFLSTWSVEEDQESWGVLVERYADDPDFVWVEDGRVAYSSVDEISDAARGLKVSYTSEATDFIEPSVTPLAPGIANVTARFETTLGREAGADVRYGGAMSMTVVNTEDGWKVLQGHTSSERTRQ